MAVRQVRILETRFDLVNVDDVIATILTVRATAQSGYITLTNPHSLLVGRSDPQMKAATQGAMLTIPDGIGIVIASWFKRIAGLHRLPGPDLMLRVCDLGRRHNFRHYLYGGSIEVVRALRARLEADYPGIQICGTLSPPYTEISGAEDQSLTDQINEARADVVWIGLGAPKQEKWMAAHLSRINAATLVGVGAAFDLNSGLTMRAPLFARRLGFEWMFRLALEPRRMWMRSVNSVRFLALILREVTPKTRQS